MFKIIKRKVLNPQVVLLTIEAPLIAKKANPGQFIILRVREGGERIPLTIADYDNPSGSVTIIFQTIGKTTKLLASLKEGDFILDFVGPLGIPSHLDHIKRAVVIGGGLGTAIAYPQAKKLFSMGAHVDMICGFRNKELIILEEENKKVSHRLFITTEDGSNGTKGFVSDILKSLIQEKSYDLVIAIGPLMMMKVISDLTKPYHIKTMVSMNPVMIDGTGMCGGCRVTVDHKTKFACVDGPDFDGHLVDFDSAIRRSKMYYAHEKTSLNHHVCQLGGDNFEK
jgi:ferredoxin/flavodoxin---NADP+ reductase